MTHPFSLGIAWVLKPADSSQCTTYVHCRVISHAISPAVTASNHVSVTVTVNVSELHASDAVGQECTYLKTVPGIAERRWLFNPHQARRSACTNYI